MLNLGRFFAFVFVYADVSVTLLGHVESGFLLVVGLGNTEFVASSA